MRTRAASHVLQGATAALLAAVLTLAAAAPNLEIPQRLLDHEARVRAAFTPAEKSREAALAARLSTKMSVSDVAALTRGESYSVMFAVMLDYMKMLNKEARDEKKSAADLSKLSQQAKSAKLANDNARIDAQMREAQEKAQNLMAAATTGMVTGVVQGAVQVGAGSATMAGSGSGAAAPARTPTTTLLPTVRAGAIRK